jgi:hypothetical protein
MYEEKVGRLLVVYNPEYRFATVCEVSMGFLRRAVNKFEGRNALEDARAWAKENQDEN